MLNRKRSQLPQEIASSTTNRPRELYLRARAHMRMGNMAVAEPLLREAILLCPTFEEALEALGEVQDICGDSIGAAANYGAARAVRFSIRRGTPDRTFVLRQRGFFTSEIAAYNSVVSVMRKRTLPLIARGNAYLAERRPEKALADYSRALGLKRGTPEVLALKGEALSMMARYDEALVAFDEALMRRPNDPESLSGRAIVRLALGKLDEANVDWRRQYELLAGRDAARACVALRMADYEAALPHLVIAHKNEPNNPYWRLYLLAARRRLGISLGAIDAPITTDWPASLLALHAGSLSEVELLQRADTDDRRGEALFQLGILASAQGHTAAERYWCQVIDCASPSFIEHAAARNELSRRSS